MMFIVVIRLCGNKGNSDVKMGKVAFKIEIKEVPKKSRRIETQVQDLWAVK